MIRLPAGLTLDAEQLRACAERYGVAFSLELIDEPRARARAFERVLREVKGRSKRIASNRSGLSDVVEMTELSCLFYALFMLGWSTGRTPAEERLYWEIIRRFGT